MVQALEGELVQELEEQLVPVRNFAEMMVADNYSVLAV